MSRHQRRSRYTNMLVLALAVIFCLAVLGAAGAAVYASRSQPEIRIPQLEPDGNVKIGTLSDPAGRQAELDEEKKAAMVSNLLVVLVPMRQHSQLLMRVR